MTDEVVYWRIKKHGFQDKWSKVAYIPYRTVCLSLIVSNIHIEMS